MFLKAISLMKCSNCTLDQSDSFEEICLLSQSFSVSFENFVIASSLFLIIQSGVKETSHQTKIYLIGDLSCNFNLGDLIMLPQSVLNSLLVLLATVDNNKDLVAVSNLISSCGSWFSLSFKLISTSSYAVLALATLVLLKIILIKWWMISSTAPTYKWHYWGVCFKLLKVWRQHVGNILEELKLHRNQQISMIFHQMIIWCIIFGLIRFRQELIVLYNFNNILPCGHCTTGNWCIPNPPCAAEH